VALGEGGLMKALGLPWRRSLAWPAAVAVGGLWLLWRFDPADWHVPFCSLYAATGLYCPGCGAVRATHELLHGRLLAALHCNALWVLLLPLAIYMAASEACFCLRGRPLPGNPARRIWLFVAIGVAGVVFCVVRNLPLAPFLLLGPPG
jgi:hypothetical protein